MPVINGKILPGLFGAGGQPGVRTLALDSRMSVASAAAAWGGKAARLALDSSGTATAGIEGLTVITGSAISLALDSTDSLAAPQPIRNGSSFALALDSGGEADGERVAGSAFSASTSLALDSTGSTAEGERLVNGHATVLALDSTGSTGGEPEVGAFSPADISGLALWLDAGAGVTVDGSNGVTEWQDQSGNGRNFTAHPTAGRPTLISSSANLNSQPSLLFEAASPGDSGDGLALESEAVIGDGTQNSAMLAVVYPTDHPSSTVIAFVYYEYDPLDATNLDAQNWQLFLREAPTGDLAVNKGGTGTDNGVGSQIPYNTPNIVHFFTGPGAATDLHVEQRLRVGSNGSAGGGKLTDPLDTTPASPTAASAIGSRSDDNFGRRWEGEIAEIIIYKKALTIEEANQLVNYLAAKYDITVNNFSP